MAHYVTDEKTGIVSLVHDHGYIEVLGTPEQVWPPAVEVEPVPDLLAVLTAKVDLLLTARIKAGEVTTEMVQTAELPEATKTELADKIAESAVASAK